MRGSSVEKQLGNLKIGAPSVKTRRFLILLGLCALLSSSALAQTTGDRIDLYFGDWHTSPPRTVHGTLEERDILTRGDAMNPTQKGAVLRFINSYAYATLAPHASTKAERLEGRQEIYFVQCGKGTARAGGQSVRLVSKYGYFGPRWIGVQPREPRRPAD